MASLVRWWSSYYGNHTLVSAGITYLHLAGILMGGGAAVTADRQILRARRADPGRQASCLADVSAVHTWVIGGLTTTVLAGILMVLADLEFFLALPWFWFKMTGVALLVANGAVLTSAERTARRSDGRRGWPALGMVSWLSLTLWFGVLLLGVWLKVAA